MDLESVCDLGHILDFGSVLAGALILQFWDQICIFWGKLSNLGLDLDYGGKFWINLYVHKCLCCFRSIVIDYRLTTWSRSDLEMDSGSTPVCRPRVYPWKPAASTGVNSLWRLFFFYMDFTYKTLRESKIKVRLISPRCVDFAIFNSVLDSSP